MNDRVAPPEIWEHRAPEFVAALEALDRKSLETLRILTGAELGDRWEEEDEDHHKRSELIVPLWSRLRQLLAKERERDAMLAALAVLRGFVR